MQKESMQKEPIVSDMGTEFLEALQLARVAADEVSPDEAIKWQHVATFEKVDAEICVEIASAISKFSPDAAEVFLHEACSAIPDSLHLATKYARFAGQRGDYAQELARWRSVQERFPNRVDGYLGAGRTLRRLHKLEEAHSEYVFGLKYCNDNRLLLVDLASCASIRSDWSNARYYWEKVDQLGWLEAEGYAGLSISQLRFGELEAAEKIAQKGLGLYPEHPELLIALADVFTTKEDWHAAVQMWERVIASKPENERYINGLGIAKWRLTSYDQGMAGKTREDHLVRPINVGRMHDVSKRDLLSKFESLGQDCEFGMVQRRFGAEPLGLLRWTSTTPEVIISGLRKRFLGLGDLDMTFLDLSKPEIMVNDLALGARFHTFIQQSEGLDLQRFREKMAKNLRYLKNIFLERMDIGDQIYVIKLTSPINMNVVKNMLGELCSTGSNKLVVVTRAANSHVAGTVQSLETNLYVGFLSYFGTDLGPGWNINFSEWLSICEEVIDGRT